MVKRYLMRKAAKRIVSKTAKKAIGKKARTSAQKAALKKAVAASARKRSREVGKKIVSKKLSFGKRKSSSVTKFVSKTVKSNKKPLKTVSAKPQQLVMTNRQARKLRRSMQGGIDWPRSIGYSVAATVAVNELQSPGWTRRKLEQAKRSF